MKNKLIILIIFSFQVMFCSNETRIHYTISLFPFSDDRQSEDIVSKEKKFREGKDQLFLNHKDWLRQNSGNSFWQISPTWMGGYYVPSSSEIQAKLPLLIQNKSSKGFFFIYCNKFVSDYSDERIHKHEPLPLIFETKGHAVEIEIILMMVSPIKPTFTFNQHNILVPISGELNYTPALLLAKTTEILFSQTFPDALPEIDQNWPAEQTMQVLSEWLETVQKERAPQQISKLQSKQEMLSELTPIPQEKISPSRIYIDIFYDILRKYRWYLGFGLTAAIGGIGYYWLKYKMKNHS
jgi:hypothetical protein